MQISDILSLQTISICKDKCTKLDAFELLSQKLAESSNICSEIIFDELIDRENVGSTALGKGVALPHLRVKELQKPIAAFLAFNDEIDYSDSGHEPVNLVFGLLSPDDSNELHLEILSQVAQLFNDDNFRNKVRQCKIEKTVLELFKQECKEMQL